MANSPWISAKDVKEYSAYESVQERTDARLLVDIARAEQYVISYTNNSFDSYEEIPSQVKTAMLLLAEGYAYNATRNESVKSETFDDYSYTKSADSTSVVDSDIDTLLNAFIIPKAKKLATMTLRKL